MVQPQWFRRRFFDRAAASAPVEHGCRREQLASSWQRELAEAGRRCGGTSHPVRPLVAPPRRLARLAELLGGIADVTGQMQERAPRHRDGLACRAAAIGAPRPPSQAAEQAASADAPIGPAERRRFAPALAELAAEAAAERRPVTSITADTDRVEASDDRSGRRKGDRLSKHAAGPSRDPFEGRDPVARYGGEGLAVPLADTPLATGLERADELGVRRALRQLPARKGASAGRITPRPGPGELQAGEPIAQRADRALFAAERTGHDRATGRAASEP